MSTEREQFEASMIQSGIDKSWLAKDRFFEYEVDDMQRRWESWQKARAIEQATTIAEAARDVGKWLNERPNRPIDLRHVAMLVAHAMQPQVEAVPSSDLNPDEGDPVTLWAEIWRLREAVKGPDGYATWQDAATAERIRRVRAESKHAAPVAQQPQARPDFTDEWTGYLKDGETPFERFLRERKDLQSAMKLYQRVLEENERLKAQQPQVMVNMVPPATARDRWMYEQGRLAERDVRTHKEPDMTEREAFEVWGGDQGYPLRRIHDEADQQYLDLRTQGAWEAWNCRAQLAQAEPPDVVRDAERYRQIRRGQKLWVIDCVGEVLKGEALDAEIDAAER